MTTFRAAQATSPGAELAIVDRPLADPGPGQVRVAVEAFAAWYLAGLEDPRTAEVEDFATFHKQFGLDFNNQVFHDAVASA